MPTFDQVYDVVPTGWLTRPEAKLLWDVASEATRVMEIGCYFGRSACVLAGALSQRDNTFLYLVDPYGKFPDGHHFTSEPECLVRAEKAIASTRDAVLRWLPPTRFKFLEMPEAAAFALPDVIANLDLVYNDGDHSYQGTRGASERWKTRLSPNGLMMFHDYSNEGGGLEVKKAVEDVDGLFLRDRVETMAVFEVHL